MNQGVRIIKRDGGSQSSQIGQNEKTEQKSEREIASTVKNWIAELARRRHVDELTARTRFFAALINQYGR